MTAGRRKYSRADAFRVCVEINQGAECVCKRRQDKVPCNYIARLFRQFAGDVEKILEAERADKATRLRRAERW